MISVVIPHRGPVATLERTLRALGEQTIPAEEYEVLVAADGPSPGAREATARVGETGLSVRYLEQQQRGPAAARNMGVAHARGEVTLLLGDDVRPAPDLLKRHASWGGSHGVLGHVRWDESVRMTLLRRTLAPRGPLFKHALLDHGGNVPFNFLYTANLSLPTTWLREEPFDEAFPDAAFEDVELGWRLSLRDWPVLYDSTAVGYHMHPYDCRMFLDKIGSFRTGLDILLAKWPACFGNPAALSRGWDRLELLLKLWAPFERLGQKLTGKP
jgi:glycosyltransferase involved in cell wall biosynthesis